jgi:hypothetical protein
LQVLHSLGRLGRMMQEVLAPGDAATAAATVLATVADALVAEVLARR